MALQSWFTTTLTIKLIPTGTVKLEDALTITEGRFYLVNDSQEEWIDFTGTTDAWKTLTGVTRLMSPTANPSTWWTGLTWLAWSEIKLVAMHDQLIDNNSFNQLKQEWLTYATEIARDADLWADWVATKAYTDIWVTATWLFYNYNLSTAQWESIDTWTTTPNASETVAGIMEIPTDTEVWAWTSTWLTWARLGISVDNTSTTPVTKKVPVLDVNGKIIPFINSQADWVASETEKWLVERSTDTEAAAKLDTTRYIVPNQLQKWAIVAWSTTNYTSETSDLKSIPMWTENFTTIRMAFWLRLQTWWTPNYISILLYGEFKIWTTPWVIECSPIMQEISNNKTGTTQLAALNSQQPFSLSISKTTALTVSWTTWNNGTITINWVYRSGSDLLINISNMTESPATHNSKQLEVSNITIIN